MEEFTSKPIWTWALYYEIGESRRDRYISGLLQSSKVEWRGNRAPDQANYYQKIEAVIKRLLQNKSPCPDGFTTESSKASKENFPNPSHVFLMFFFFYFHIEMPLQWTDGYKYLLEFVFSDSLVEYQEVDCWIIL